MAERKATQAKKKTSNTNQPRKPGRPTTYTEELADRICAELACGNSMRTVCKAEDMPAMSTVFLWLRTHQSFSEQYAQAKAEAADALVEEMLDIADDATNDWMETHGPDGEETGYKLNGEHVQRSKLRVDTRKWIASKLKPKKYGERLDLNHDVQEESPLSLLLKQVSGNTLKPKPQGDGQ